MKINWKAKLSSRKFWAAIISFITSVGVAFNIDVLTIQQVTVIIGGIGALVVYILTEGYVDAQKIITAAEAESGDKNVNA